MLGEPSSDVRNKDTYKMYLSGKRPIEVAIELKLNTT